MKRATKGARADPGGSALLMVEDHKSTRVVRMGWVQAEFVGTIVPSGRFELPTCGLGNRRSVHTELRGRIIDDWQGTAHPPQPFASRLYL